jgi:hypothetical protein
MSKKQYIFLVALALIGGLIGGAFSNSITSKTVLAQKGVPSINDFKKKYTRKPEKVVEAEEFRLLDKDGRVIAKLVENIVGGGTLRIYGDEESEPFLLLNNDRLLLYSNGMASQITLGTISLSGPKPFIELCDKDGPRAVLGSTNLVTKGAGANIIRSPASLVLFDEKGNVIWSIPQ